MTPLCIAITQGDVSLAQALYQQGCALVQSSTHDAGLINAAVRSKNAEMVHWLLKRWPAQALKQRINQVDAAHKTPIWYALEQADEAMVKALVAHGACINQVIHHMNPLLALLQAACCPIAGVRLCLSHGIDLSYTDRLGHGACWYAVKHGHDQAMDLLIAHHPPETAPPDIYEALYLAKSKGNGCYYRLWDHFQKLCQVDEEGFQEVEALCQAHQHAGKKKSKVPVFTKHAQQRMKERKISHQQVISTIAHHQSRIGQQSFHTADHVSILTITETAPASKHDPPIRIIAAQKGHLLVVITTYRLKDHLCPCIPKHREFGFKVLEND